MQFQDMGNQKVKRGLHLWKECMKSGKWPGYSEGLYTIEPDAWSIARWEYKKAMGE
jgi:hypothetical protein